MKRILTTMTAAVGVCALLGSAAAGQSETGRTDPQSQTQSPSEPGERRGVEGVSKSAKSFVEEAAADSAAEIKLGELARQKASHDEVKEFGERMIRDHRQATEELKRAAGQDVAAAAELKPKHQKVHDKLSKLSGEAFDREYMKHMVQDHQKAVKLFRRQAKQTSDRELSQFASSTLPTLEEHLEEAKRIQRELREDRARGTAGTTGTSGAGSGPGAGAGSGADDEDRGRIGDDDMSDPPHSEPPPPTSDPEPAQRP